MLKVYEYKNCGTCRKALKWLDARGVAYERIPIRDRPPSMAELKRMLKVCDGELRRLFNSSGGGYRELNLKDHLKDMPTGEALALLAANGNLVKRPFVLGPDIALVGFDEETWAEALPLR